MGQSDESEELELEEEEASEEEDDEEDEQDPWEDWGNNDDGGAWGMTKPDYCNGTKVGVVAKKVSDTQDKLGTFHEHVRLCQDKMFKKVAMFGKKAAHFRRCLGGYGGYGAFV